MIDSTTYKQYADYLSQALDGTDGVSDTITDIETIYNTYIGDINTKTYPGNISEQLSHFSAYSTSLENEISEAIVILQDHVETNSGMTINEWLTDQGILVLLRFAQQSNTLGYPIELENIDITVCSTSDN